MKKLGKIVLHIPAREGSKRVPKKNLRFMNGKPMISYAVEASLNANITDELYVNTDSEDIIEYIRSNYPKFKIYQRDKSLANDMASSDQFNVDIIQNLKPETLIMINPVCPLIEQEDIRNALTAYSDSECDTLITCTSTQMQTFCEGVPINININEQLAPSQDNKIINTLNWAITIWNAKSFNSRMEKFGYAVLGEKRLLFNIDPLKSIKVSEEKDFRFAELLIRAKTNQ